MYKILFILAMFVIFVMAWVIYMLYIDKRDWYKMWSDEYEDCIKEHDLCLQKQQEIDYQHHIIMDLGSEIRSLKKELNDFDKSVFE